MVSCWPPIVSETLSTTALFQYIIRIHICFCLVSIHLRLSSWLFAPASIPPGQSWGPEIARFSDVDPCSSLRNASFEVFPSSTFHFLFYWSVWLSSKTKHSLSPPPINTEFPVHFPWHKSTFSPTWLLLAQRRSNQSRTFKMPAQCWKISSV